MAEVPPNWREEMEQFVVKPDVIKLLREGPKSLAQSWRLMALKNEYKRIKGIQDPEPPNCQSSFKEWNDQTKSD